MILSFEYGGFEEMPSHAKDEWDQYTVPANPPHSVAQRTGPAPAVSKRAPDEWDQYAAPANSPHPTPPLPKGYSLVPQRQDDEQTKEDVVNATIGGLVFFDYLHRYEIVFPNDWKHSPTRSLIGAKELPRR